VVQLINVQDAKTHLSRVLARVEAGEEVILARGGKPIARLVPVSALPPRPVGFVTGQVDDTFFAPLSEGELADWE